jgi:pyruvate-formate lyase-activating enzyme
VADVLLVSANTLKEPYPVPPIGVCMVAERLERLGHRVRVHDCNVAGTASLPDAIASFQPQFVTVGVRNVDECLMDGGRYFIDALCTDVIAPIRAATTVPLILGGSGFSIFPEEMLAATGADYGVAGEGETAMAALLERLASGAAVTGLAGVYARGAAPPAERIATGFALEQMAPPNIDERIDFSLYGTRGAYPVQTKRGCAHRCVYCSYPAIEGRRFRARPPEAVVDEIAAAAARLPGVTFEFVDSTFNDPPGHAEAICREIIARGLTVRLRTMGVNPAGVTPELLDLMRRAGFAQIDSTPDTASPAMLRAMGKNFTREELERTAALVREHRLPTMWFFLLGGPGESEATLLETFDFIDRHVDPQDMVLITEGLRVYPHTALHPRAVADGVVGAQESLLRPVFYVEPTLGRARLKEIVERECARRDNCVPATESKPGPEMMGAAMRLRAEQGLDEPMFRTLLRLRKEQRQRR